MFQPDEVSARIRQLRIVWMALLLSVAAYAGAAWFLLLRGGLEGIPPISPAMLTYAAVVIILILPLARVVRRKVESVPPHATADEVTRRWQAGWIVGQALRESVGILGITLSLLAGSIPWVWGYAAASIGSQLLAPPWEHELRLRLRRATTDPSQTSGAG